MLHHFVVVLYLQVASSEYFHSGESPQTCSSTYCSSTSPPPTTSSEDTFSSLSSRPRSEDSSFSQPTEGSSGYSGRPSNPSPHSPGDSPSDNSYPLSRQSKPKRKYRFRHLHKDGIDMTTNIKAAAKRLERDE